MKKIITSLAICLSASASIAQVGAVAPDFTQSDINGTSHNLYNYLNAGKVVIVDMSATWCGPCWGFHTSQYLEDLYAEFGSPGTNEVVILFYEDDVQTTLADLNGTGGNTQGDWVTGTPYPIINGTVSLPYPEYGEGYPTVSVICPTDKKIKYNLFNSGSLAQMRLDVQDVIDQCATSASIDETTLLDVTIAPNPTTDNAIIRFNTATAETAIVNLYSVSGQLISTTSHAVVSGTNEIELNLASVEVGTYFVKINSTEGTSKMISVVKK